ncbi:uncharacterized protein LOC120697838 isoform X2 [Panicum virgatum]|uniref:uncharacterized protein LOC120697838 isoform X2 n=1 Tax=Panicum virgatum TaxID=38727 RepID=UPI0019D55058|nr:uncharacterized protein LOC120697838 isoform X2 [Panicum virgatum]
MASLRPSSPPTSRARRAPAGSSSGVLPPDVLFDVFLRLAAKELCRLRAVCHSWRCLTTDPLFITAHVARHPGPLFLAKLRDNTAQICIVDLSGNVVKRIPVPEGCHHHHLLCTRLNLACLATDLNKCHVLNPATGAVYTLPEGPAVEHVNRVNLRHPNTFFALGRVTSTGEYKVLRMFNRWAPGHDGKQLFEAFTINGGSARHAQWRGRQGHDLITEALSGVVVDGVVYFLMDKVYGRSFYTGISPDHIVSFDLGTEEWRRDLQGPISRNIDSKKVLRTIRNQLTLVELKGFLVISYYHQLVMDLWFLMDFETGLWVKEYSIQTESIVRRPSYAEPLLVLDDGRLVIYLPAMGRLLICDPGSNTFSEVEEPPS